MMIASAPRGPAPAHAIDNNPETAKRSMSLTSQVVGSIANLKAVQQVDSFLTEKISSLITSTPSDKKPLNLRLRENDPELTRLDLTASSLKECNLWRKTDLQHAIPHNKTVETVHLSGSNLTTDNFMTPEQVEELVLSIRQLESLQELCVFQGNSRVLTEDLLADVLDENRKVTILMLWDFVLYRRPRLASTLRQHPSLERITLTLPTKVLPWAVLDVYIMALASMPVLKVLQIRCQEGVRQTESIFSPEAAALLVSSRSIDSLYLENCGLLDDHMDAMLPELMQNKQLTLLDLKDNLFTDDALYTLARLVPVNATLTSLDVSGVEITDRAGHALAVAVADNTSIQHLELEGTAARFANEFEIPVGHSETDWMKAIVYQIRLNRAGEGQSVRTSRKHFCQALNSVSDHLDCLYYFMRTYPFHCEQAGDNKTTTTTTSH